MLTTAEPFTATLVILCGSGAIVTEEINRHDSPVLENCDKIFPTTQECCSD